MSGAEDGDLVERCRRERRGLITLELEFANPLVFRPSQDHGIAVLRLARQASPRAFLDLMNALLVALDEEQLDGKPWIVEIDRFRVYQEGED
jgi:hypothetical protein